MISLKLFGLAGHAMTCSRTSLIALAGTVCLLLPSPASAAQRCADDEARGITAMTVTKVTCQSAMALAIKHDTSRRHTGTTPVNGWTCKGTKVSATREKVLCRKGARRVAFRSTLRMEFVPAEYDVQPNAGGS